MRAFFNGVIYKVFTLMSRVLCVSNSIFVCITNLYTKIECAGEGVETYIIREQNLGNTWQFWGFRPSGSTPENKCWRLDFVLVLLLQDSPMGFREGADAVPMDPFVSFSCCCKF